MKKAYLIFNLIFLFAILSCSNQTSLKEQFFYKRYKNDSLVGYTVRNYTTQKDTLRERIFYLDNNYQIIDSSQRNKFLLKKEGLDILYKKKGKHNISPYVSLKEKGKVIEYISPLFGKVESTYKGKINFNQNKGLYKIQIKHVDMKGVSMNVYLDNNFKLIGRDSISILIPFDKELKVDKNEFPSDLSLKLN